jgi:hypothetical protein
MSYLQIAYILFIKGLQRDFTIEDATGKSLKARTVFSLSIKYLRDDLMNMTKKKVLGKSIREDDIKWVLTVPAIWNDVAKQFMREAAEDVQNLIYFKKDIRCFLSYYLLSKINAIQNIPLPFNVFILETLKQSLSMRITFLCLTFVLEH